MRDSHVRQAVLKSLRAQYSHDANTRIVEEMGIWSGSVRIDVAVINGELHGFELKSDRDTLTRLESQAELYSQVFDRVTLVVGERHIDKAVSKIPGWWGVIRATLSSGELALCETKTAKRNPNIEPIQLARLLWRTEALAILERRGFSRGFKSRTSEIIATRLAEVLSLDELSSEVRETLKLRSGWLGQAVSNQRDMTACSDGRPQWSAAGAWRPSSNLLNAGITPTSD